MDNLMDKIISLAKRRGFIFPGSEIYGGLANSWDYGPLGAELKKNIKDQWWERFVRGRSDMVGIDPKNIMNPNVWEASGHIKNFSDPLVECKECHQRFREDEILKKACPACGGKLTQAKQFNLLFKTFLGPTEEKSAEVYLRGELAQAMFVDFPAVIQTTRKRLPFGIAAQGTVFRNEITPGNFIFRTREFDLMEFEYFIRENEWEKYFEYWKKEMWAWIDLLGVSRNNVSECECLPENRAHYSKKTIDFEYNYPFGKKELYGLAYRSDFDLKNHMEVSEQDMRYTDSETGEKFLPHVIEPTFGLDRSVLVALLEAYHEEQAPTARSTSSEQAEERETAERVVMKFPFWLAPYKAAVLPLSKKEPLVSTAQKIHKELREAGIVCDYDETQSIGRRYRRQDEIGTPFCITVDFETEKDQSVTVRNRDTMKQERVAISELKNYLQKKLAE